jgi:hypothetical protein
LTVVVVYGKVRRKKRKDSSAVSSLCRERGEMLKMGWCMNNE